MSFIQPDHLPNLATMYQRNAHIIATASCKDDYKYQFLNADDKGNLYRMGKIARVFLHIGDYWTDGSVSKKIDAKVAKAINKTLDAIIQHTDKVKNYCESHANLIEKEKVDIQKRLCVIKPVGKRHPSLCCHQPAEKAHAQRYDELETCINEIRTLSDKTKENTVEKLSKIKKNFEELSKIKKDITNFVTDTFL